MKVWITTLWLLLAALACQAAPGRLEGKVTRVTDGDSLWVEPATPGAPVELRLEGIDAPEICQAWGPEAKQELSDRVLGQQVSVKTVGRDMHGRTLGTLYLGTQNINKLMVQEGHAWSSRYKYDRGPYVADERMAKALSELVLGKQVSVKTVGRDTHGRTLGTLYLDTQNINKLLVQEGHAWSTRYKYDRGPYVADERMARALSRGLNRAGGAVMPRDFRQLNGPCHAGAAAAAAAAPAPKLAPVAVSPVPAVLSARCDGRKRCTQMRSCEEATWFLKHCPGVEMDGDGDGVPCERQWCGR